MRQFLQERHVEFVDASGHDRHARHGWLHLRCPICESGKFHLGYNEEKHYFYCWNCGWHSAWEILKALFPNENIKNLLSELRLDVRQRPAENRRKRGVLRLPSGIAPLIPAHRKYLTQRGFSPEKLEEIWQIQGIGMLPEQPKMQWRIFIPVTDNVGTTVSWITRAIGDVKIPYIAANKDQEAEPLKTLLYGEQFLTHYDTVIVTEGVFDAWNIGIGAVCTFGKAVTGSQIRKISQYHRRIICFDNEPEAQADARRLCEELSLFPGTTLRVNLDADDPGSADEGEIRRLRKAFLI